MAHRFTCGEKKIWQIIEKSQNIMKLIEDGIKNIEGLDKLLGGTKDEKSQMYIKNNLNKIKNSFPNIYIKGLLSILLIGKKQY